MLPRKAAPGRDDHGSADFGDQGNPKWDKIPERVQPLLLRCFENEKTSPPRLNPGAIVRLAQRP